MPAKWRTYSDTMTTFGCVEIKSAQFHSWNPKGYSPGISGKLYLDESPLLLNQIMSSCLHF